MKKYLFLALLALLFQGNVFANPGDSVKTLKVLAIGDSTTAGTPGFRSGAEAPPLEQYRLPKGQVNTQNQKD